MKFIKSEAPIGALFSFSITISNYLGGWKVPNFPDLLPM